MNYTHVWNIKFYITLTMQKFHSTKNISLKGMTVQYILILTTNVKS
jgi:hypothetical protein